MVKEWELSHIDNMQESNPFEFVFFYDDNDNVKLLDGYQKSNVFSSINADVIVRFYSRTKENDDEWREIVEQWRKEQVPYKKDYTDMERQ